MLVISSTRLEKLLEFFKNYLSHFNSSLVFSRTPFWVKIMFRTSEITLRFQLINRYYFKASFSLNSFNSSLALTSEEGWTLVLVSSNITFSNLTRFFRRIR